MDEKVWVVCYAATHEPLEEAQTKADAEELLQQREADDKADDLYTPDFYEVIEMNYYDLPWAIPLF